MTRGDLMTAENHRPDPGLPRLDRRGFVLQSLRYGTAAGASGMLLTACEGTPDEDAPADGSFEAPYTSEDPGQDPDIHLPVAYGALIDGTTSRIWVEVLDVGTDEIHPQETGHYISKLVIHDEFGNEIDALQYRYDNDARLIASVDIPTEVSVVHVYSECSTTGWWRTSYNVDAMKGVPLGDLRRPLTTEQPGDWPDKIEVHQPIYGRRPDGSFTVEIGDRTAGKLHEMTPNHYMKYILVFDEYHQLRAGARLDPVYNTEPVIDFPPIGGTSYVRVVAFCNLHDWWEAIYSTGN